MPFRARFDCLWCGTRHLTRTPQDLEGWASLCPTCIGRAGDNGFLRARLHAALADRAEAADPGAAPASLHPAESADRPDRALHAGHPHDAVPAPADSTADDFYRRAGRFASGAIQDAAWLMELDAVTAWVDGLRLGPVIVELGAGTGWWSTLLAAGAELWAYDPDDAALDELRRRLIAHGLRAHLHRRDLDAPADRAVDSVFAAFALGAAQDDVALARRLDAIAGWLRPGGSFAFVEVAGPPAGPRVEGPMGLLRPFAETDLLELLDRHGLRLASVAPGGRALVAGLAEAVAADGGDPARDAPVVHEDASMPAPRR